MFKPMNGAEGKYSIGNKGTIYSHVGNGTKLAERYNTRGYQHNSLSIRGKVETHRTHRLVALHWVNGWFPGAVVHHIDEDKTNNNSTNLVWVTQKENMLFSKDKQKTSVVKALAKTWVVTHKSGVVEYVYNLSQFCRDNNLNINAMYWASKNKNKEYGGFKVEYV